MDEDNEDAMVVVRVGFRDTISQHLFDEESNDEEALDGCTEYGIDLDCIRACQKKRIDVGAISIN